MKCSVCGSLSFNYLYELSTGTIIECTECGIIRRESLVVETRARQMYDDDNRLNSPYYEALKMGADTNVEPYLIYNEVLRRLGKAKQGNRLLDIGCAYGAFMETAKKDGWDVYGVDISKKASLYALNKRHLNVRHGTVEEAKYPDNYFSIVTMWDVVEHLEHPLDTLREVNRVLAPDGAVVVFTINQKSIINFVGHHLHRISLKRLVAPLVLLYSIEHNYFFCEATLRGLLKRAGIGGDIEVDWMDAKIERWQSVHVPPLLAFGSKCLDLVARVIGGRYRMIFYAKKG